MEIPFCVKSSLRKINASFALNWIEYSLVMIRFKAKSDIIILYLTTKVFRLYTEQTTLKTHFPVQFFFFFEYKVNKLLLEKLCK